MTTVRRGRAAPPPPPAREAPRRPALGGDEAPTPTGWTARTRRSGPDSTAATLASAQAAAAALRPQVGPLAPAPLLQALGDGVARLEVPLQAGTYAYKGVSFTVAPGTVAHVSVQVKDGELAPVGDGQPGTALRVVPPLDLPLWVTGRGLELRGGEAQAQFQADLGGFFDLSFEGASLSELVSGTQAKPAPAAPAPSPHPDEAALATPAAASGSLGALARQLVDLSRVKVDATVTMREATLDVGGVSVQVDPATTFSVQGDGRRATVQGHVALDGFALDQGGVQLASRGGGRAELSATVDRLATGYQVASRLSDVRLSVDSLVSAQPSAVTPGQVDKVVLGPTELRGGEVRLATTLGAPGTAAKTSVELSFQGAGTVQQAQLTVKDAKDAAGLSFSGRFDGAVAVGPKGVTFDATVTQARVEVRDLQATVKGNQVSLEHARAEGEVRITQGPGELRVEGSARSLELAIDDFQGGAGSVQADLGRTTAKGSGTFSVGTDGVRAEGRLRGTAALDGAAFERGDGQRAELGRSTVSGELTRLNLGRGAPELRLENVAAELDVSRAALDVGQTRLRGGGAVQGRGTLVLDARGLSLDGKAQVSMQLDDGRVQSSTVDLQLAKGSAAALNVHELSLGTTSRVAVGPGSRLDAVLAGGSLTVGGQAVELQPGGRAAFTVTSATVENGKSDLRGSVAVDARVKASRVTLPAVSDAGVTVRPADVSGRLQLSLDDAHLADDRLSFRDARVRLDAQVGRLAGAAAPGGQGYGSLAAPVAVRSVDEVKQASAAQLAGLTPASGPASSPVEALSLLREGTVKLEVPLQGTIEALGLDVVTFPPGARLGLALAVKDGRVVPQEAKAELHGGVKALGVKVVGAHLDAQHRVVAELEVAGRTVSVPVPGAKVPADMAQLGAKLAGRKAGAGGGVAEHLDLEHGQIHVTNATFGQGRLSLPGGVLELTAGAKLSFHGTALAGELTGTVGLDRVQLATDDVALQGTAGRADLRLAYRREGGEAVVEGTLSNLALSTDAVVRKADDGDYVALGAGRMTGASVALGTRVPLGANGLPDLRRLTTLKGTTVTVPTFEGELHGARLTSSRGLVALGPTRIAAAVGFTREAGLTVKGTLDTVDAELADVTLSGRSGEAAVERGRLRGRGGTVDLGPKHVAFDAPKLAWDLTVRDVAAQNRATTVRAGQVRVTGEGHFSYDVKKELRVEGQLQVEGRGSGVAPGPARSVTVARRGPVTVER